MNNQLIDEIAATIASMLEAGTRPWMKPWEASGYGAIPDLPLRSNGVPFTGINSLWLGLLTHSMGYSSPYFLTFKQALDLGGAVRKGEKSIKALLGSQSSKTSVDEFTGEETKSGYTYFKPYSVFNASQCDGLPDTFYPTPRALPQIDDDQWSPQAIRLATMVPKMIVDDHAYYRPSTDVIAMPPLKTFRSSYDHGATLAHETIHATGAAHRTNRLNALLEHKIVQKDSRKYRALEELVAEIGSIKLCTVLGIPPSPTHLDNHASYIGSWAKLLRDSPTAIMTAASLADVAADFALQATDTKTDVELAS